MRDATHQSYQERVLHVLRYIEEHLDESHPLDDLARIACFSPYHFHRIFRGIVGEPVGEYVRRLRLERAARRLSTPGLAIHVIAEEAGYESHEAFTRAFEAHFGSSPSEYRHVREDRPVAKDAHTIEPSVHIECLEPIRVCFARHIGPFERVGETWGKLMFWAGPRGLIKPNTRFIGIWHDDPDVTPPDKLRGDVCFTVEGGVEPGGPYACKELEGGEYAVAVHRGPYESLGETYAMVCGPWAASSGRELADRPAFEMYLNDPRSTPPEELLTSVQIPLV
jgi:AraC family transcriptional regulator